MRKVIWVVALLLVGCASTPPKPTEPGWHLRTLGAKVVEVQAGLAKDHALVAWIESDAGGRRLYVAERNQEGWGEGERLSDDAVYTFGLAENAAGDVVIAWREGNRVRVRARRNGAWQPVQNLAQADPMQIAVAVDEDGTPWVAWREKVGGDYRIRVARDPGGGFVSETISPAGENADAPDLAVRGGEARLVWSQNGAIYASAFRSDHWQSREKLDDSMGNGDPQVVLGSDAAAVFWRWDFMNSAGLKLAELNGGSWSMHSLGGSQARAPAACASDNRFLFIWSEPATAAPTVLAQFKDGEVWQRAEFLSRPGLRAKRPAVACAGSRSLAAWIEQDDRGQWWVFFAENLEGRWKRPQAPNDALSSAEAGQILGTPAANTLEDKTALIAWVQQDPSGVARAWIAERR